MTQVPDITALNSLLGSQPSLSSQRGVAATQQFELQLANMISGLLSGGGSSADSGGLSANDDRDTIAGPAGALSGISEQALLPFQMQLALNRPAAHTQSSDDERAVSLHHTGGVQSEH